MGKAEAPGRALLLGEPCIKRSYGRPECPWAPRRAASVPLLPARGTGSTAGLSRPIAAASGLGGLCSPGCLTVADAALLFSSFFSFFFLTF